MEKAIKPFDQRIKVWPACETNSAFGTKTSDRQQGEARLLDVSLSPKAIDAQRKLFADTIAGKLWTNDKARKAFKCRIVMIAAYRARDKYFKETGNIPFFQFNGLRREKDGTWVIRFRVACDEDGNLARPGWLF